MSVIILRNLNSSHRSLPHCRKLRLQHRILCIVYNNVVKLVIFRISFIETEYWHYDSCQYSFAFLLHIVIHQNEQVNVLFINTITSLLCNKMANFKNIICDYIVEYKKISFKYISQCSDICAQICVQTSHPFNKNYCSNSTKKKKKILFV